MDMTRSMLIGGGIAFVAAAFMAVPEILSPAIADEEPAKTLLGTTNDIFAPALDPRTLLKWDFHVEPGVSTEATAQSTVKKIGYGRTSYVTIVQTPTGVYSSDGLASANIEYPGITKERRRPHGVWELADGGWRLIAPVDAGSIAGDMPLDGCVAIGERLYC